MGRIGAPYGVKGGFHVVPFTEELNALTHYSTWWVGSEVNPVELTVAECRIHGKGLVARFTSIDDRDVIALEKHKLILIPRQWLPEPDPSEVYLTDVIGLNVVNTQGQPLGIVDRLLDTGTQELLVIKQGDIERLVPFVTPIVLEVDMEKQLIVVDWGIDY